MNETAFFASRDYMGARGGAGNSENTGNLIYLRPEQIRLPLSQRERKGDSPNAVIRLAESLKKYGVLEPLSVRLVGDAGGFPAYELVSGARRLAAARLAGLPKLPCIVLPQDDKSYAIAGLIGSLRAGALNMFEQASLFRTLLDDFCMTQEEIARKLSLSQSAVANKLRLLRFSPEEKMAILTAKLTERHARALLRISDSEKRMAILDEVIAQKLNVAATESAIDAYLSRKQPAFSAAMDNFSAWQDEKTAENERKSRSLLFEKPLSAQGGISSGASFQINRTGDDGATRTASSDFFVRESEGAREEPVFFPRKFALPDLRPLYNSIERTLSIFRKTGETANLAREEDENCFKIVITIPKRA